MIKLNSSIPNWLFVIIFVFWIPLTILVGEISYFNIPIISQILSLISSIPGILIAFLNYPIFQYYFVHLYEFPKIYPFTGGHLEFTTLPWAMLAYFTFALIGIFLNRGKKIPIIFAISYFLLIQFVLFLLPIILGLSLS